ncbi:MAG: Small GTP-binding domain protein [Promethearchaeota archaeon]|jgi:Ras-related protein Rab-1A|nr:MAG: Small GTP-binding domain protein [Candidatus Lokiarchaeota archaeon]
MIEGLIKGLVYIIFHDVHGTNPKIWVPDELDEQLRMLCGIKAVSLLTGEESYIPKKLTTIPIPSRNLKAMLKFLKWEDESRRGGIGEATLVLLFHESDDVIFYKAKQYLEDVFEDTAQRIIELEVKKAPDEQTQKEVLDLRRNIKYVLRDLKDKELIKKESDAFPLVDEIRPEAIDFKFKIVVCGDARVGKTSTILRFTDNAFTRTYLPTLGVNISEKAIKINNHLVQLVLWDIAGQSKFERMRVHFYQGMEATLLIFDLTNAESFEHIEDWHNDIKKNMLQQKPLIGALIGNKSDLEDQREVSYNEASQFADELDLFYLETSALTGENVNQLFLKITREIIKSVKGS